ncbi:ATP-binding cassette domain-containing protein [Streptomyces massasporeus]|uniref:ATP-binding cassette domain-containing protein n=1 Tax=Streptomyces massasporeus TaxID=67324 RepID=A0ABW6L3K9_9ACTN
MYVAGPAGPGTGGSDDPRGWWTAVTGPSGAGKTTLLSLIAGAREPSSGTARRRWPAGAVVRAFLQPVQEGVGRPAATHGASAGGRPKWPGRGRMTAVEGRVRDAHMTLRPGVGRSGARGRPSHLRLSPAREFGHVSDDVACGVCGSS